jgi:hypothetical protein
MSDFTEEGGVVAVPVEPSVPYSRDECIKVEQERVLFVEDDIYKSIDSFKEQIPGLPEYVYWILFLRYNRNIITEEEIRFAESTISRLRNSMKEEQAYYQKLFADNSGNLIDCSVGAPTVPPTTPSLNDLPVENA